MHFCGETNTESERVMILNCPMIIFTDSFCRYHLFNNNTSSAEFCRHNFFQFEHIPSHWVFTSTEAEPDRTFRLKAAEILSPGPEEAWHGAVAGAELDPWQSTVVCLGSRSLVSFSPMLAWRNQGREILRRVLPDFGGLLGLVIVAIMSTIFFLSLGIYITVHAGPLSQSHLCSPALDSPLLSTSHCCHQTLKAIFPVIVASTETFSLHVHIKLFGGAG